MIQGMNQPANSNQQLQGSGLLQPAAVGIQQPPQAVPEDLSVSVPMSTNERLRRLQAMNVGINTR